MHDGNNVFANGTYEGTPLLRNADRRLPASGIPDWR